MKAQLELDYTKAAEARDAGIEQAVQHADAMNIGWSEKAWEMFQEWLSGWPKGFRFQIETFRASAGARGLPHPPTARAFGQIAVRGRKEGLIRSNGQKPTTGVTAHRCYSNEWEKI